MTYYCTSEVIIVGGGISGCPGLPGLGDRPLGENGTSPLGATNLLELHFGKWPQREHRLVPNLKLRPKLTLQLGPELQIAFELTVLCT